MVGRERRALPLGARVIGVPRQEERQLLTGDRARTEDRRRLLSLGRDGDRALDGAAGLELDERADLRRRQPERAGRLPRQRLRRRDPELLDGLLLIEARRLARRQLGDEEGGVEAFRLERGGEPARPELEPRPVGRELRGGEELAKAAAARVQPAPPLGLRLLGEWPISEQHAGLLEELTDSRDLGAAVVGVDAA